MDSCITVLDATIGNYDFDMYKSIKSSESLIIFGDVFTMAIVITFNILILNLIIAILSNTYNMFDTKSTGLYLSKILNARDDMTFDENYGAFLLAMTPMNVVVLPFVPIALFSKPSTKMNTFITILQYSVFIVIIYAVFMIGSVILIPFAYLKTLLIKLQGFFKAVTLKEKIVEGSICLGYIVTGMPLMFINIFSDFYYFWANNFRTNLKKIIIERKKSSLTNDSIRQINDYCVKYNFQKIKSVFTTDSVKSFRQKFSVIPNIQYLLFG